MSFLAGLQRPRPPIEKLGRDAPARCLTCFYVIEDLDEPRCPECGLEFDPRNPNTYTTKPPFVRWRFWLPGFAAAAFVAVVTTSLLLWYGNWGYALWFGVPTSSATLLAYRVRAGIVTLVILGMAIISVCILTLMTANFAGVFCAMILTGIVFGPVLVGIGIGAALRLVLKHSDFSQRAYLPVLLALLIPMLWGVLEGRPTGVYPIERIATTRIIKAPVDDAWDSIMFYEEVELTPPVLLRIGLAHPLRTFGSSSAVGDTKTCVYNKGHITKQVSEIDEHRLMAFTVSEQEIGYEHDVRLVGGSFAFEPLDGNHTRVTLTTEYEPLLTPRFAWRWGEEIAVHTLHSFVLEGMARHAERNAHAHVVALGRHHETQR